MAKPKTKTKKTEAKKDTKAKKGASKLKRSALKALKGGKRGDDSETVIVGG